MLMLLSPFPCRYLIHELDRGTGDAQVAHWQPTSPFFILNTTGGANIKYDTVTITTISGKQSYFHESAAIYDPENEHYWALCKGKRTTWSKFNDCQVTNVYPEVETDWLVLLLLSPHSLFISVPSVASYTTFL